MISISKYNRMLILREHMHFPFILSFNWMNEYHPKFHEHKK